MLKLYHVQWPPTYLTFTEGKLVALCYRLAWIVQDLQSQLPGGAEIILSWSVYQCPQHHWSSYYEQADRKVGAVPLVYLGNWITKPRCPQKPMAKNKIGNGANWISLTKVVSAMIITFPFSHGEEPLLVFHASAKKRIKGDFSLCHWRESPFHPNELFCLQGARLICLRYPLCIVSRLTHICVSSFTIKWYKWMLSHMVAFHYHPLPCKTLQEQFKYTGEVQIYCLLSKDLLGIGVKFHPWVA